MLIWIRYIAYAPHSYRLVESPSPPPLPSYIPIDFGRILSHTPPPIPPVSCGVLACFTLLEWSIHIYRIFVVEKGIPCSSFTKKIC